MSSVKVKKQIVGFYVDPAGHKHAVLECKHIVAALGEKGDYVVCPECSRKKQDAS